MQIKEKYKKLILNMKESDPETLKKVMDKIPDRILFPFFINFSSKDNLKDYVKELTDQEQAKRVAILEKLYYRKYRTHLKISNS